MIAYDEVAVRLADPRCLPFRAHPTDAGADLVSVSTMLILPGEKILIDTGVAIKIPVGFGGFVFPRSSHGKIDIQIANGTGIIDSGYRGNLKVLLKNGGTESYYVEAFTTRIAQLVISPIFLAKFALWSDNYGEWDDTPRSIGGFGSTGV